MAKASAESKKEARPELPDHPKQARAQLSMKRMLSSAAEIISERGYEGATLALVAERAGYSHGLVTRRFGSKEGLLWSLMDTAVEEWGERRLRKALAGTSGVESIKVLFDALRSGLREDVAEVRAYYALMFTSLSISVPSFREEMRSHRTRMRDAIERSIGKGMAQGTVRSDADPDKIARIASSAFYGAIFQWMLQPDFELEETMSDLEKLLSDLV